MKDDILHKDFIEEYSEEADVVQLVGTKLGDEEYAIDVLKIQEIIRTVEITIVPRMDHYILGVMNLRGKVIPVIDLRIRFGLGRYDFDKETRIIVVRFEKQNIGFVVDEVTEVIRIERSMVEPSPPLVGAVGQEYVLGICKFNSRLIMLLDIDRVVGEASDFAESDLRKKMLGIPKNGTQALAAAEEPAPVVKAPEAIAPAANDIDAEIAKELAMREAETEELNKRKADEKKSDAQADLDAEIAKELAMREAETAELNKRKAEEKASANELDIDAEIARELAMREAETEELNKRKAEEKAVEDALDIDAQIAKELAMREAETEALNKKKSEAQKTTGASEHTGVNDDDAMAEVLRDAMSQSEALFKDNEKHIEQDELDALIAKELAKREAETEELNQRNRQEDTVKKQLVIDVESKGEDGTVYSVAGSEEKSGDRASIQELKDMASKIISGEEASDLSVNIKGEIGELLKLIVDTKSRVDDLPPTIENSQSEIPVVTTYLTEINNETEHATDSLRASTNELMAFYDNFVSDVKSLKGLLTLEKKDEFITLYDKLLTVDLPKAQKIGLHLLEALEFQDITEQKLRKVIKSIEDIGLRIGTIVGFLYVQNPNDERRDKLLADYGLS